MSSKNQKLFNVLNTFLNILDETGNKSKIKFYFLIFLTLLTSIIEIIGVGILFPIFDVFTKLEDSKFYKYFNLSNFDLDKNLIFFYSFIILIFVFLIKNILILFNLNFTNKFFHKIEAEISEKILINYIQQETINKKTKDLSTIFKNARSEVIFFCDSLKSTLNVAKEIIILTFLIGISIFVEPLYFLICLVFFSILALAYNFTSKKYLKKYGEKRVVYEGRYFHYILNFIDGLKEISILNAQDKFFQKIKLNLNNFNSLVRKKLLFNNSPKYLFEVFGLIFLALIIGLNLFFYENNIEKIIPVLIFFVIVFYRILPSISVINSNLVTINYHKISLDIISQTILNDKNQSYKLNFENNFKFNDSIKLKNISLSYDDNIVFENMNFELKKNNFYFLTGPSGSGKSTLINLFLDGNENSAGKILIDGSKVNKTNMKYLRQKISIVHQDPFIMNDTIINNITLLQKKEEVNMQKINDCCRIAEIYNFVNNLPMRFETMIGEDGENISGGQKQRIAIARALYFDREIIFLDESTNALDKDTENKIIKNLLNLTDKTILCVGHKIEYKKFLVNQLKISNKKIEKV